MLTGELKILDAFLRSHLSKHDNDFIFPSFEKQGEHVYARFLDGLNQLLIFQQAKGRGLLGEYLNSYNLPRVDRLQAIISDYYSDYIETLAEEHAIGNKTKSSEYLFQIKNERFLEHLDFIVDLKKAATIEGRADLKKHLNSLEALDAFELKEDEIKSAFKKLEERELLRERLNNLNRKTVPVSAIQPTEPIEAFNLNKPKVHRLMPRWVVFAAAAIFLGAGLFIAYRWLFPTMQSVDTIAQKQKQQITVPSDDLQMPKLESRIQQIEVLREPGMGFAGTAQSIKLSVEVYNIQAYKDSLTEVAKKVQSDINRIANTQVQGIEQQHNRIESLNRLKSKLDLIRNSIASAETGYSYNKTDKKIELRLTGDNTIQGLLSIINTDGSSSLYLKMEGAYYRIKQTEGYASLEKETNSSIIDHLNRIEFLNSN